MYRVISAPRRSLLSSSLRSPWGPAPRVPPARTSGRWPMQAPPRRAASRISWSMSAIGCSSNPIPRSWTPQSIATLDKQAQWLRSYAQYSFTVEGHADERGTREYNIALGARRAQAVHDYLVSRGVQAQPHEDDFLRQGTAGRGLRRHLVLVAEPPLGDGPRRQLLNAEIKWGREQPAPRGAGCALRAPRTQIYCGDFSISSADIETALKSQFGRRNSSCCKALMVARAKAAARTHNTKLSGLMTSFSFNALRISLTAAALWPARPRHSASPAT